MPIGAGPHRRPAASFSACTSVPLGLSVKTITRGGPSTRHHHAAEVVLRHAVTGGGLGAQLYAARPGTSDRVAEGEHRRAGGEIALHLRDRRAVAQQRQRGRGWRRST